MLEVTNYTVMWGYISYIMTWGCRFLTTSILRSRFSDSKAWMNKCLGITTDPWEFCCSLYIQTHVEECFRGELAMKYPNDELPGYGSPKKSPRPQQISSSPTTNQETNEKTETAIWVFFVGVSYGESSKGFSKNPVAIFNFQSLRWWF